MAEEASRKYPSLNTKADADGNIIPLVDLMAGCEKNDSVDTSMKFDSKTAEGQEHIDYVQGIRFWLITFSLASSLFLTSLEIPIVTTSLVSITDDLGGFDSVGWVISSYLLGYVGVLIIFAKMSDIFGRKAILASSISIFIIFSAACGASQTITQLIVFRAFQGAGGGGCFAVSTALITEIVPPERFAKYAANLSSIYALSLLLGPILGGAISSNSNWRWIFLLNIPAAAPALAFTIFAIPKGFPYHKQRNRQRRNLSYIMAKSTRERLDIIGAALLLLATLSFTAGFEEADARFPWRSAYVITLLTVSGLLWISLLAWERHITIRNTAVEPVLPWRFFQNRVVIGLLLNSIFLGGPWFVAIFQLPQKFQLVNGSSALQAGIKLVPFTIAAPVGSMIASTVAGKLKVPVIYVVFCSASLQVIGFSLLATLPESTSEIPSRTYGYQVIAGFGCGMNISTLLLIVPFCVEFRDKAVGMGAISQLRPMGGAIVLAIATSVFNSYTRPRLHDVLGQTTGSDIARLSGEYLAQLPAPQRQAAREILSHGYNLQMIVLAVFAAAQIPATLLMWQKKPVMV